MYSNYGSIAQCKELKNYFLVFFPARTCCFEAADMCQDNLCMRVVTISESHEKPFPAAAVFMQKTFKSFIDLEKL